MRNDDAFVARVSPIRMLLTAAAAAGFVAAGLWIAGLLGSALNDAPVWAGWLCVVFFGPLTLLSLKRAFETGEHLRVDREGIRFRQWSDDLIPWDAIDSIDERRVQSQRFLSVRLIEPDRYPSSKLLGRLAKLNSAMGFAHINLSVTGTDRSFEELAGAVERFAPRPAHPFD